MSSASFRKIRFFGPGRCLAAPEGPKIAGGASLGSKAPASLRRFSPSCQRSWERQIMFYYRTGLLLGELMIFCLYCFFPSL